MPSPATADARTGRGKGERRVAGKRAAPRVPRGPAHVVFARDTALRYEASAKKTGASADRPEAYRGASSVGEFFDRHPGSATIARKDLAWDLNKGHCSVSGFVAQCNLKVARLDSTGAAHAATGVAYAVMAAVSSAGPWKPLPAAVCAVEAAAGDATERALLARFAEFERVEADTHQEQLAGSLASLSSVMPGGNGDGLRLYSVVLVPAGECAFDEVRDAALRDDLRIHQGLPCTPGSIPKEDFAADVLTASEPLGVVSSVQAATTPAGAPPGTQAPIRSVAAAKKTGQWEGPGGWKEAFEDEIERVFRSTKVVPVSRRRKAIQSHGRGKV